MEKLIIGTVNKYPSQLLEELNGKSTLYRDKFGEIYVKIETSKWKKIRQSTWFLHLIIQVIWTLIWLLVFRIWLYDDYISSKKPIVTYLLNSNWSPYFFYGSGAAYLVTLLKNKIYQK